MTITDHEMSRRQVVARLVSKITDAIGTEVGDTVAENPSYWEVVRALHRVQERFVVQALMDEWKVET